jgi:hypothetical protein
MARPQKDPLDRRTETVLLSLTPLEKVALIERADAVGVPLASYARTVVLGQALPSPAAHSTSGLVHELNQIGVHLDKLSHTAQSAGLNPMDRTTLRDSMTRLKQALDRALS